MTQFLKKSVSLQGHRTSIALEKAFWEVLKEAASAQGISLIQLIQSIDVNRKGALSSALRLYALAYALGEEKIHN